MSLGSLLKNPKRVRTQEECVEIFIVTWLLALTDLTPINPLSYTSKIVIVTAWGTLLGRLITSNFHSLNKLLRSHIRVSKFSHLSPLRHYVQIQFSSTSIIHSEKSLWLIFKFNLKLGLPSVFWVRLIGYINYSRTNDENIWGESKKSAFTWMFTFSLLIPSIFNSSG